MFFIKWGLIVLAAVIILGGVGFFWLINAPIYKIGSAAKLNRTPHTSGFKSVWQVEKDIQLNHFSTGAGRNVLFVHGGPGIPLSKASPAFDLLHDTYRVHYYDQRGTGNSSRPIDGFTTSNTWQNIQKLDGSLGIAQQLADIDRIRKILGDEKLIIIGHSYGGLLASLYAAEFPENVENLVLISPADLLVMPPASGGLFDAIEKRISPTLHDEYKEWLAEYLDFGNVFSKSTSDLETLDERFIPFYEDAMGKLPIGLSGAAGVWHVRAQFFAMGKRHDWRNSLSVFKGRVLIIRGQNDLQPAEVEVMYASAFTNAHVVEVPEADHFAHNSHPKIVSELVREFLD